jgi:hypothetical protein
MQTVPGYCWRIQSQPRKHFKFDRIKRISSLFGWFANCIRVAASTPSDHVRRELRLERKSGLATSRVDRFSALNEYETLVDYKWLPLQP